MARKSTRKSNSQSTQYSKIATALTANNPELAKLCKASSTGKDFSEIKAILSPNIRAIGEKVGSFINLVKLTYACIDACQNKSTLNLDFEI